MGDRYSNQKQIPGLPSSTMFKSCSRMHSGRRAFNSPSLRCAYARAIFAPWELLIATCRRPPCAVALAPNLHCALYTVFRRRKPHFKKAATNLNAPTAESGSLLHIYLHILTYSQLDTLKMRGSNEYRPLFRIKFSDYLE